MLESSHRLLPIVLSVFNPNISMSTLPYRHCIKTTRFLSTGNHSHLHCLSCVTTLIRVIFYAIVPRSPYVSPQARTLLSSVNATVAAALATRHCIEVIPILFTSNTLI